jgi:hypothetical protein
MTISPEENLAAILASPTYKLAELDTDLLQQNELRPVRVQLELLKPEIHFKEQNVHSTIVVFGGTKIVDAQTAKERLKEAQAAVAAEPGNVQLQRTLDRAERINAKSGYYDAAREFARIVSSACQTNGNCDYVIVTGGGPGIMEAANRGAFEIGAPSIGFNIELSQTQQPNAFTTPDLTFQFRYFGMRKMHLVMRAAALVVFPGGFGTLDELFEMLTLTQTHKTPRIPIVCFDRSYWTRIVNFDALVEDGMISRSDLQLFGFADDAEEAWEGLLARGLKLPHQTSDTPSI